MANFFLSKNFAKPGDIVDIQGICSLNPTIFISSDEKIAVINNDGTGSTVSVVGIGEVKINEDSSTTNCTNGSTGILLTATEDGKPFFMAKEDYFTFTNYEGIFVFFILMSAFIIRFVKKS